MFFFVPIEAFNFLAHPVLNYVPARAQLELLSRIIEPSEARKKMGGTTEPSGR